MSLLRVDTITNSAGNGSPTFPNGLSGLAPQTTVLTSGAATYMTPVGSLYLRVRMIGAGGGGGGSGTGSGNGGNGTDTTFGVSFLTAGGGPGGPGLSGGSSSVSGGTSTGGDINATGFVSGAVIGNDYFNSGGGNGADSQFGQGGLPGTNGGGNASNGTGYGAGGGGAGGESSPAAFAAPGGGAGGYLEKIITSPLATYGYVIGTGGTGGTGPLGAVGGNGSDGLIIVTAFFQ